MHEIHITHTSMGVRVEATVRQVEIALKTWAERSLHAPKMGKSDGRITIEQGDGFYAHLAGSRTFIFHKAFLEPILSIIKNVAVEYRLDIQVIHHDATKNRKQPYGCTFPNHGFELSVDDPNSRFYYQNDVVEAALDPLRAQVIFAIQTGRGKAAAHGTRVRVPGGWKKIEEIKVGDYVTGGDGRPTRVTGVHPQGIVQLYQVTFDDGRSVDVCGEHLWQSFYVNTTENRRWGVRSTLEMKRLISMPNPRVYIPLPEPEETTEKEFSIHPYVLGVLIGDGCISSGSVKYAKADMEIFERVSALGPEHHTLAPTEYRDIVKGFTNRGPSEGHIRRRLEHMGLWGCRSWEKFIPAEYFEGSIEQRWELLRGLFDTDGTTNKDGGQPSFTSTSKALAIGVQELVRSLGGIASMYIRHTHYTWKGEKKRGRESYTVRVRHKKPSNFFHLPRKKNLCRDEGQYTDILKLRVKSIEPTTRDFATCISVDNADSLYVVDQYIVTHNTKSLQKVMVRMGVRTALIMRPTYKDKWLFDCCEDKTGLLVPKEQVLVCQGVQSIYDAYEMGENGELDKRDIRIVIIPTTTLQLFLKEYCNTSASNPVNLDNFYDALGVGLVGYDEVHEHFLLVYLSGIMLNPPKTVEMSATLEPGANKVFIRDRYMERFPPPFRLSVAHIPVVDVRGFYYTIEDKKLAWWASKMTPYNHKVFEGKLMREGYHESYAQMWYDIMEKTYLKNYQPGQNVVFLFATIDFCEYFTQFVKAKLAASDQFHALMVSKYNGGDSYDDFIMADIGISTPSKAGTAIDKPGMIHMYVSTPIDDQQLNEQIAGRPRPVNLTFGWDMNPTVWFGHAMNIAKHGSYLNSRMKSLTSKVLSFKIAASPYVIRKGYDHPPTSSRSRSPLRRLEFSKVSRKRAKGVSGRRRRR